MDLGDGDYVGVGECNPFLLCALKSSFRPGKVVPVELRPSKSRADSSLFTCEWDHFIHLIATRIF